jgi:hypothetical protein
MGVMFNADLQRLEGVWTGTEHVRDDGKDYDASGRLVFQTVFDGRFLLCDYVQTAPERPTAFAHGVFRRDDRTHALTVTWFRSPATPSEHTDAVAEGDKWIFSETVDGRTTRTSYSVVMDRLSVYMERATRDDEWKRLFEGSYRRR